MADSSNGQAFLVTMFIARSFLHKHCGPGLIKRCPDLTERKDCENEMDILGMTFTQRITDTFSTTRRYVNDVFPWR